MSTPIPQAAFNWRSLTSMITTGGFLIMGVTGLMLYATPEGRLAYWVDWSMLGLTKEEWGAIHVTSSLVFLVAGFVHLWYNWRQFVAYLRFKYQSKVTVRPEGPVAAALMAVLVAGTLTGLPPFTYVLDLSAAIKASWSVDAAMEPPFGHAEDVSLDTLALRTASSVADIVAAMRDAGYTVGSTSETMRRIADANDASPAEIWVEVQKRVPSVVQAPLSETKVWTVEMVDEQLEGRGFGGKTVAEAAGELGLDPAAAIDRLAKAGVEAAGSDQLRALAETRKTTPTELLKVILVDGYALPAT